MISKNKMLPGILILVFALVISSFMYGDIAYAQHDSVLRIGTISIDSSDESNVLLPIAGSLPAASAQKFTISYPTKKINYSKVKLAAQYYNLGVKSSSGATVKVRKESGSKYITVSTAGKVTVKKGTPIGSYTAVIKLSAGAKGSYRATSSTATIKVLVKKVQTITVAVTSKKYKESALVNTARSFSIKPSATAGTIVVKKLSGSSRLSVSTAGKVTVKKGTPAGTYKVKVKVTAKATSKYFAKSIEKTIKVTVTKPNVYADFLNNRRYKSYTSDWDFGGPERYALLDINADGTDELLIASDGNDSGVSDFVVFSYNTRSKSVDLLPINGSDSGTFYDIYYQPKYDSLVYLEARPSRYEYWYCFDIVDGNRIKTSFEVGYYFSTSEEKDCYYIDKQNGRIMLSKSEFDSYFEDKVKLSWKDLP